MPVGVFQLRPGGEIIQFHLFHQERPWHDGERHRHAREHARSHKHNVHADAAIHTRAHTLADVKPLADGLASVAIPSVRQHAEQRDRLSSGCGGSRAAELSGQKSFCSA